MNIEIGDLRKKDCNKAIGYAIEGMHFDWYLNSRMLLYAYGKYFWYMEMNRATLVLAAYVDGEFSGVLLAEMYGEEKKHQSLRERLYIKLAAWVQRRFFKSGAGVYEKTIRELQSDYLKTSKPDGELLFLAAKPNSVKGIGSALLAAFAERAPGKTVFLHTDDACTYQFYEHRGFERVEERQVLLEVPKGQVPLRCFIYCKTL